MRIQFYATREDLINIVTKIEQDMDIKYIVSNISKTKELDEHSSLVNYNNLGISRTDSFGSERFWIVPKSCKVEVKSVKQIQDGSYHYFVDSEKMSGLVILIISGMYNNEALIMSEVNSTCTSEIAKKNFKMISKIIKQQCKHKSGQIYSDNVKELYGTVRIVPYSIKGDPLYDFKIIKS